MKHKNCQFMIILCHLPHQHFYIETFKSYSGTEGQVMRTQLGGDLIKLPARQRLGGRYRQGTRDWSWDGGRGLKPKMLDVR